MTIALLKANLSAYIPYLDESDKTEKLMYYIKGKGVRENTHLSLKI